MPSHGLLAEASIDQEKQLNEFANGIPGLMAATDTGVFNSPCMMLGKVVVVCDIHPMLSDRKLQVCRIIGTN